MVKAQPSKVLIPGREEPVSALVLRPKNAWANLVLAHGAGAGMQHEFMEKLAVALADRDIATFRFQFPYMNDGKKRPDAPALATKSVQAAVASARQIAADLPLFAAGKSFGGRMTTTAAANDLLSESSAVSGIILFGFPLHQAKEPAVDRAKHLAAVRVPMLFLQGTRDDLADLTLMTQVTKPLPLATLHVVDHADHSFSVLKRSGRDEAGVLTELAETAAAFMSRIMERP